MNSQRKNWQCTECEKRPAYYRYDEETGGWWTIGDHAAPDADICRYCVARHQLRHMIGYVPSWPRIPSVLRTIVRHV